MILLFGKKLKYFLETVELYKQENAILKAEIAILREDLSGEREERKHLNELILTRTGFIQQTNTKVVQTDLKPFGNGVANWQKTKLKLEAESRKTPEERVVEQRWEDKVLKSAEETAKLMEKEENATK